MLFDSPRTRALPFPGLPITVAALALALAFCWTPATSPSHTAPTLPLTATLAPPATSADIQLADEITRRLRRMGINFSRTRLPHPYDPVGEVC